MNCEYQTYRDGRLQDCGKPATHQGAKPPKRCYCAEHNALVTKRGGLQTRLLTSAATEKGGAQ